MSVLVRWNYWCFGGVGILRSRKLLSSQGAAELPRLLPVALGGVGPYIDGGLRYYKRCLELTLQLFVFRAKRDMHI